MFKDFNGWNVEKQKLDVSKRVVHPKPREIRYIKMGINIGSEIHGKEGFFRPVLVISKLGSMYFCLAMSTQIKNMGYAIQLHYKDAPANSFIVINQGRIYDIRRFSDRMSTVPTDQFIQIKNLLRNKYFPRDF